MEFHLRLAFSQDAKILIQALVSMLEAMILTILSKNFSIKLSNLIMALNNMLKKLRWNPQN